ncbi:Mu transposase C-terminal domain-containing protein [Moritella viscosa]|uniref:Mu transposase C-terminal domain-containing protein n=1 Tax=Moritella viscosa TaxID=80854 RepID=UPI00090F161C|nr:Mu transposase C-terminal domain-containing protein [Moritella viscosa]SHN99811.1 Putative transposase [Moritella viscosa]SHN99837.1 Putative transposase [Moritella viscosa]SHO02644.1 Putative transposase [Moritella viscosa]
MSSSSVSRFNQLYSPDDGAKSKVKQSDIDFFKPEIIETFQDVFAFTEEQREEAIHRFNLLSTLVDIHGPCLTIKNIELSKEQLKDKFGSHVPSTISIYRYWKLYKESDFELSSLIPKKTTGNTKSKVSNDVEPFINDAINCYFHETRPTQQAAYTRMEVEIDKFNELHNKNLSPPTLQAFHKRLKKVPAYDKMVIKQGQTKADNYYRKIGQQLPTSRVLERVEADHTRLDLFVIDEVRQVPMGRPYLTVLHDNHTKSIIGFYLGFEPPSFLAIAMALENAILPKDYVKELYPRVQNSWPCCGLPENLIVDNGAEFNSYDFKICCKELNINVGKNPVRKPWLKASIERFFGTLNKNLLSPFPGKSFCNIFERGEYDPLKNAIISIDKIIEFVHIWLVDIYQSKPNQLETNIPNLSWCDSINGSLPPRLFKGSRNDLKFNLSKNLTRKLNRNGIKIASTIRYSSKQLSLYFGQISKANESFMVNIKYNPSCLSKIYVLDERNNTFFSVPSVDLEYASSVSMWLHQKCLNYARHYIRKNYNHKDVIRAWRVIFDLTGEALYEAAHQKKPKLGINERMKAQRILENSKRCNDLHTSDTDNRAGNNTAEINWDIETDTEGWSVSSVQKDNK